MLTEVSILTSSAAVLARHVPLSMYSPSQPAQGWRQGPPVIPAVPAGMEQRVGLSALPGVRRAPTCCSIPSQLLSHDADLEAPKTEGVLACRHSALPCPALAPWYYLNSVLPRNVAFSNDYFTAGNVSFCPLLCYFAAFFWAALPLLEHTSSWGWSEPPFKQRFLLDAFSCPLRSPRLLPAPKSKAQPKPRAPVPSRSPKKSRTRGFGWAGSAILRERTKPSKT